MSRGRIHGIHEARQIRGNGESRFTIISYTGVTGVRSGDVLRSGVLRESEPAYDTFPGAMTDDKLFARWKEARALFESDNQKCEEILQHLLRML